MCHGPQVHGEPNAFIFVLLQEHNIRGKEGIFQNIPLFSICIQSCFLSRTPEVFVASVLMASEQVTQNT
jgi:hypothetical protein